jgi:hypothetical protein
MAKNWLNQYSNEKKSVAKFQQGGMVPPEQAGAAPAGPEAAPQGGAPDLEAMLAEYAQTRDPQLAVAICDMLVEATMGGGAPAGPEGAPGGAPMARNGMKVKAPVFKV